MQQDMSIKIEEYKELLENYKNEQELQAFLEKNTEFIPREFVQNHGIHCSLVFRKYKLADDYTTDFLYLSKSTDDWNLVLIEIEKPETKFFKENGDFHVGFIAGLNQIDRWRAWFMIAENKRSFEQKLAELSIRIPVAENPCHIKYVLVTGRREEYADNKQKRGLVLAKEREDFKILTFDSLCEDCSRHHELYLCVKHNDHFQILTESIIDENVFLVTDSGGSLDHIRIKKSLKKSLIAKTKKSIKQIQSVVRPNLTQKMNLKQLNKKLAEFNSIKTFD